MPLSLCLSCISSLAPHSGHLSVSARVELLRSFDATTVSPYTEVSSRLFNLPLICVWAVSNIPDEEQ